MRTEENFIGSYYSKKVTDRINTIYENYYEFPQMIASYKCGLVLLISSIKQCERRDAKGELGVRIQTSSIQDPVAQKAVENMMIEQSIEDGTIENMEFEDDRDARDIAVGVKELNLMKLEYKAFKTQFEALPSKEKELIKRTWNEEYTGAADMADDMGLTVDSVYNKVNRIKKKLKGRVGVFMVDYTEDMQGIRRGKRG